MWYNYFEKGFEPHIGMWSGTVESQWKWSNLRAGKKKKDEFFGPLKSSKTPF